MADLTSIGVTSGIPSSGTGTVATINQLINVGAPISNGSTSAPVTVGITGASSGPQATQPALVAAISPNSSVRSVALSTTVTHTVTLSSNPTVILSSNPTVILSSNPTVIPSSATTVALSSAVTNTVTLSSNPTITSVSSGIISIGNGANTAAVKAAATAATSADPALVVTLSPIGGQVSSNSAPVVNADQYGQYAPVAAGQTQAGLSSSFGRIGDYLAYVTVFPNSSNSGAVTIFDSTAITVASYGGGASFPLASPAPFTITIGAYSVSSGWRISTGSSVSALAIGKFT